MAAHKYEVHYLNDNFIKRIVTFMNKKEAKQYVDLLAEYAVYLYKNNKDGSQELLYKHETSVVADGSYLKYDWVIAARKKELFSEVVTEFNKLTELLGEIYCSVTINNKTYKWNGSDMEEE